MPTEPSSPFGISLKRHRLAAGLSQEELAARAGLSPHGISDLERGARRTPRPSTLRLLADALGLAGAARAAFLRAATGPMAAQDAQDAQDVPGAESAPQELVSVEQNRASDRAGGGDPATGERLPAPSHNLPLHPTPMVGREREVEQVTALLRGHARLVTISGPGGVGKTRLSLGVAAELADSFQDGVWLVRLSQLTDPALVLPAIARTLRLRESGVGQFPVDALYAYLSQRRLLLLLDNFEQLVAAAPDVAALLETSPGLKVLVTSRTRLRVRGEHEYGIAPLALPDLAHLPPPEHLSRYAAVALFCERARAARAGFQVTSATAPAIAAICSRLDGLPLALELAAARVKVLPPHALLVHLGRRASLLSGGARDLDARQRTMWDTISWSYALLSASERRLFRRLSVFLGGCTLEAAEAVCAAPAGAVPLALDVLEGLSALVDQSLVRQLTPDEQSGAEPRFGLLNVIREYALEQLETSDEADEAAATRDAHVAYFADRARDAGAAAMALSSHTEGYQSEWLADERDNFQSALTWASEQGHIDQALWIAAALAHHDIAHGSYTGARRRLESLLAAAADDATVDSEARLLAVSRARRFASVQHDIAQATRFGQEQLALARQTGNLKYVADALSGLALLAMDRGVPGEAAQYAQESLSLARQSGDPSAIAFALENVALARYLMGNLAETRALAQEGLALSRQSGFLWGQGINACILGLVCCREADPLAALRVIRDGYAAFRDHGGLHGLTGTLMVAAGAWAVAGNACRSARLFGAAEAAMAHAEGGLILALRRMTEELAAPARTTLGEDGWARALAEGWALSLADAFAEALDEEPVR